MERSKQRALAGRGLGAVLAAAALALAAGPACRSGAPGAKAGAPVAPPDLLRTFVGQTLILRHRGDDKTVALKRGQLASLSGECDVVVEVRSADFERGTAGAASRGGCHPPGPRPPCPPRRPGGARGCGGSRRTAPRRPPPHSAQRGARGERPAGAARLALPAGPARHRACCGPGAGAI